jgi:glycosyltransferase involved in cell wall biosynthesis
MRQRAAQKLSVVIPTRNRAAHLAVAIASVLSSSLVATPRQIFVVDDDSSDNTVQVVDGFDANYVKVRCHSPSGTRNAGLAAVQTPYVTFLDDDDAWLPRAMESQVEALDRDNDVAFAYGMVRSATESLVPLDQTWPAPPLASGIVPEHLYLNFPQIGTVLFRRALLAESGGFNPSITFGEDAEAMLRVAARRPIVGVESVSILFRQRAPSIDRSNYFWNGRSVVHWHPRDVGLSLSAYARFEAHTRGLFAWRFCEDALRCAELGQRREALICLSRALRISPPHTLFRQQERILATLRTISAAPKALPKGADHDDLTSGLV